MARHDDVGIANNAVLIRAVHPGWIEDENGTERLTSATFVDGHQETSCFVASEVGNVEGFCEVILPSLSELLGIKIEVLATISVQAIRTAGLWVYRRPEQFRDNAAHVVICPPDGISKSQYVKRAKSLVSFATKISVRKDSLEQT